MKKILYIFFLIVFLLSCQNRDKAQARKILNEWIDKEIFFPENLNFSIQGSERASNFVIRDSEYKIVAYVDPLDFAIYNDSMFIIPDYSGENRLCRVGRNGRLIDKIGIIPTIDEKALKNARPALAQAWRSFLDYNPNNGILAAVTQLGEVVEVYNLKDSTHTIRIGEHGEPEFKVSDGYGMPTGIMGFSDVQVTDSAIYTVFHGTSFKEIARQSGRLSDGGKYIYVFSLKGEPLCRYVLDHYIYGIWVDEATKTIIATDVNNDEPILKFNFG